MVELFPTAVLDTSILTAVLVGLLVVWALQEWLGWGFTGLVVPGYLASVIAIQPLTGGVMMVEAVATWLVIVALSDALPRWWPWSPLFGRDRFFLALLGSVGVRLAMEGAVFPMLAERYHLRVAAELHSMGLVIVPLLAYAIWRNGPVRAVPRLGVPLLITWAVLEHVLLARTNLSLGSFELTYEDLAVDFVSSPRAYVLLLCGAWLGSVANLRYGWDFGGIIVPGLLALCWVQPERLVATVGESLLIALALQLLLRLPALREMNLAGGRTLVLAMLLGYSLKFVLGHALGAGWPGLRLRQLFGFGYLLPSLMALRMVRSGDPLRTIVPALATSLLGFVGGTALAYVLAVALPAPVPDAPRPEHDAAPGALELVAAAWADRGPVPADLEALLHQPEPVLLRAGDGFGALWLRPEGRPLVVSARVGRGPDAQAALGLAEEVDARGVLLCGPHGPACEEARRRLGLSLPLLVLGRGPDGRLRAGGRLLEVLPLSALEPTVGPLALERSEGSSTLVLPEEQAWRLASLARGQEPEPWEHPLAAPMEGVQQVAEGQAGLVRHDLVQPLLAWAEGQPWADDALRAATRAASSLGARVTAGPDQASVVAPDWRLLVRRGGEPLVIVVPRAEDDPNAAALAMALATSWNAILVVLDSPPSWRNEGTEVDRLAHAALLGALEHLGAEVRVIGLRGVRDLQDADADVVLSVGRPVPPGAVQPGWLQGVVARLDRLGLQTAWYDGTTARLSFRDGANPARTATEAATGDERHATLFVSSPARARAAPPAPGSLLNQALEGSDLPVWDLPVAALAAAARPGPPDPAWAGWIQATADLASPSPSPRALATLHAEAGRQGATTGIACDPVAGCRWLAALRCQEGACDGVIAGLSGAPPTDPATPPGDRLVLGDGLLPLGGLSPPGLLGGVSPPGLLGGVSPPGPLP